MKKYFKLLLLAGFAFPVVTFAGVSAQTGTTDTTTPETTTTTTDDAATRGERLTKRKAAQGTKLTTAQQKRLLTVCKAAQGKATSAQNRIKGLQTSRTQVYGNLVERLTKLSAKLQAKGVDTAELQAEITNLQTQIDTFKADVTAYRQAVDDLVAMDCAADPAGFQASLDAARAGREKLQQESTAIKTYVEATIKPTLKKLRDQVAKTETTGTTTDTERQE
jgi:hypothetical protein